MLRNKKGLIAGLGISTLLLFTIAFIIGSQSYFNQQEINSLVNGAEARNLDYKLEIHNQWTNEYSFKIVE